MHVVKLAIIIAGTVAFFVAGTVIGHRMQFREADPRILMHAPQLLIGGVPLDDAADA
jgi:uncharacterized membrane protein